MESIDPLKHTPGPWEIKLYKSCLWIQKADDKRKFPFIADVFSHEELPEGKANANLIAAAPDLLDVLKACKEELVQRGYNEEDSLLLQVEQAIAKAEPSL